MAPGLFAFVPVDNAAIFWRHSPQELRPTAALTMFTAGQPVVSLAAGTASDFPAIPEGVLQKPSTAIGGNAREHSVVNECYPV